VDRSEVAEAGTSLAEGLRAAISASVKAMVRKKITLKVLKTRLCSSKS
jgi:hypothetical protein